MRIDEELFTFSEKLVLELKQLYRSCGYQPYRMSKFEEYDLYAEYKDFLVSDTVLTFTDTNGKLMALKPDVTLSIINSHKDLPETVQKVFYNENVYRSDSGAGVFREILQTGLECFGDITKKDIVEVILLAVRSLQAVSEDCVLSLSDLSLIEEALENEELTPKVKKEIFEAFDQRSRSALKETAQRCGLAEEKRDLLLALLETHGPLKDTLPVLQQLFTEVSLKGSDTFLRTLSLLEKDPLSEKLRIDFSVTGDIHYYNGIIFKGYVGGIPESILSGGQYDRLMQRLGRRSRAIGFAVYTGQIEEAGKKETKETDAWLNIALPKGRLGEKVYSLFAASGYECPEVLENSRKLIFENLGKKVRYFWVKPSDVAVYVERGTADIGVVGKDILLEQEADVYELLDLLTGVCKLAVAGPKDYKEDPDRAVKVATKFPNVARKFYRTLGKDIDVIKLNGSIEIAPLLGLSDVIVDIVETGRTLKENGLEIKETIAPVSARLIANPAAYAFRSGTIDRLTADLARKVKQL